MIKTNSLHKSVIPTTILLFSSFLGVPICPQVFQNFSTSPSVIFALPKYVFLNLAFDQT